MSDSTFDDPKDGPGRPGLPGPEEPARAEAEALARRLEALGNVLSHDLRNPIAAIAWTSKALVKRGGLDERQLDAVGRIAAVARRMERLVGELLDFARAPRLGGVPVQPGRADVELACTRAIEEERELHPDRQVRFARSGPNDGPWDPGRLQELVADLVAHALGRAPEGTVVEVTAAATEGELLVTVRDEGPALSAEALSVLFDPLRGGDLGGSVGLGLYVAREIARAHGGDVRAASDPADGTSLTARLPRSGAEPGR